MSIFLRVTDKSIIDAVSKMRGPQEGTTQKTVLELCPAAHSIYFEHGVPVGLLIDPTRVKPTLLDSPLDGLRLKSSDIPAFGRMCVLYEPNRRTLKGKDIADALDGLAATVRSNRYAIDLIGPRIKTKLIIEDFGFDYRSQARVHSIAGVLYVAIQGVSAYNKVFDAGHAVEVISKDEYRAAVKRAQAAQYRLMFSDRGTLVIRAKQALDPFIPLEMHVVNALLTDIYDRVISEPTDISYYINHVLLPKELTYVYTTLVGILHAFYEVE